MKKSEPNKSGLFSPSTAKKITYKKAGHQYVLENKEHIAEFATEALLQNHELTKSLYKDLEGDKKTAFRAACVDHVIVMLEQISKQDGMFIVAEDQKNIVGIAMGLTYKFGSAALSSEFFERTSKSSPEFLGVLAPWNDLMEKYEVQDKDDLPEIKIFEQALMVVDPSYAGKGIGTQMYKSAIDELKEQGFDAMHIVTSSKSSDGMMEKVKKSMEVQEIDALAGQGLTLSMMELTKKGQELTDWFNQKGNSVKNTNLDPSL